MPTNPYLAPYIHPGAHVAAQTYAAYHAGHRGQKFTNGLNAYTQQAEPIPPGNMPQTEPSAVPLPAPDRNPGKGPRKIGPFVPRPEPNPEHHSSHNSGFPKPSYQPGLPAGAATTATGPIPMPTWVPAGLSNTWQNLPYFAQNLVSSQGGWNEAMALQQAIQNGTASPGMLDWWKQYQAAAAQGPVPQTWTPTGFNGNYQGSIQTPSWSYGSGGGSYYGGGGGGGGGKPQQKKQKGATPSPLGYGGTLYL